MLMATLEFPSVVYFIRFFAMNATIWPLDSRKDFLASRGFSSRSPPEYFCKGTFLLRAFAKRYCVLRDETE